ncbi:uncharacterized protein LOC143177052 [Calliopsis andreniformis]|uniref:uncharacterized protein LOC143177052 n=1 Tax=Calliopsis andreniformis TaxID=337506 RepID=UPI003FCCFED0
MRITTILLYKVHNIPYRYRGKYRIEKKPTMKDIMQFKRDIEREEQNMLLLRHPYLTVEQSKCHMAEFKANKYPELQHKWQEEKNEKFNRRVTIMDRLGHLRVSESWD